MDLYQMFQQSGPLGWPLLACSVLATAVAVERFVIFARRRISYTTFVSQLTQLLDVRGVDEARDDLRQGHSPLARVAAAYLNQVHAPAGLREEIVAREASFQLATLEKRLHWLAVIGSLAPMIGLLGTVLGLVEAFRQIETLGGQVQPADLASGIWTALLTTVFGLSVALPSLAAYHFLEQRVGAIQLQMQWLKTTLDEWFCNVPQSAGSEPATQPLAAEVLIPSGE